MNLGHRWTRTEDEIIVDAYLRLLEAEKAGHPLVKAVVRREVEALTGRSKGSVEYKMQNISAVMQSLNCDWITGYKPAANYQTELADVVREKLGIRSARPDLAVGELRDIRAS